MYTDIDFSPRVPAKVTYEQMIVSRMAGANVGYLDNAVLLTQVSLLNLLGSASMGWAFITNDDLPRVADSLADLCDGFLKVVPDLVTAAQQMGPRPP
jgi:hypothetical protein